ncbi:hypothetical protein [Iodidimonas sp. SYSU 1G8]|uniref:hypothetical protein n=1 Tax=Iodidimonas sp. SYSU 1G8 TaxID=3133967 RepID=UPI0031FF20A4
MTRSIGSKLFIVFVVGLNFLFQAELMAGESLFIGKIPRNHVNSEYIQVILNGDVDLTYWYQTEGCSSSYGGAGCLNFKMQNSPGINDIDIVECAKIDTQTYSCSDKNVDNLYISLKKGTGVRVTSGSSQSVDHCPPMPVNIVISGGVMAKIHVADGCTQSIRCREHSDVEVDLDAGDILTELCSSPNHDSSDTLLN